MFARGCGNYPSLRACLQPAWGTCQEPQLGLVEEDDVDLIRSKSRQFAADRPLTRRERQGVVDSPLVQGEEALLQRIKQRLDRSGYEWPSVRVCWRNVTVTRAAVAAAHSLPSLPRALASPLQCDGGSAGAVRMLDNATGVLRPGSMTLVLGPPGSGRSTLLRLLTGQLRQGGVVSVEGAERVTYNGRAAGEFVLQRTAAYVDQVDKLVPGLTCRETLNFSEACGGASRHLPEGVAQMMRFEAAGGDPEAADRTELDDEVDKLLLHMLDPRNKLQTEYTLAVLGLSHAADTLVGDAMLRGVSGGERRRVAVGEALVTPALILALDEASTGLDSASTLALVQSMRRSAKVLNSTVIMTLLQPEPCVVDLFDDLLLLSEGRVVFHGPREEAPAHFAAFGLRPLPGQALAEFLQQAAAAQPEEQRPLLAAPGAEPLSPERMAAAFWASPRGQRLRAEAEAEFTPSAAQLASLETRRWGAPWPVLLRACAGRLLKTDFVRNWEACALRWSLALFMALVTGALFFQLPVDFAGGVGLLGMLFQVLFFIQVLSVPTIEQTFAKRVFRQRDYFLYPAWVEWLPAVLLNAPVLAIDVLVYGLPVYFLLGFTPTIAPLLSFLCILFAFSLLCDNIYRAYGAAARVLSLAMGVGVCHGLVNEMLAGFVITPQSLPVYWRWFFWANPLSYAFRAMAVNEFSQPRWAAPATVPVPGGEGAPPAAAQHPLGEAVMAFFEMDSNPSWVWGGAGVLAGMAAVCAAVSLAGYAFNSLPESPAVVAAEAIGGEPAAEAPAKGGVALGIGRGAPEEGPAAGGGKGSGPSSPQPRGVAIAFKDVGYSVAAPGGCSGSGQQRLQLLQGVTGSFRPGVLTALMGSSGAGKTTLLDVIAGRKTAGETTGDVFVDGRPRQACAGFARLIGYVEQMDVHAPLATVGEALLFSASLRAPAAANDGGRSARRSVEHVLELVELRPLRGRLVGTPGLDGLSAEQRKRLTIAVELVAAPQALFLDEPTSGLDARSAALVARIMRQISRQRMIPVASTIHQPSDAIFAQFDELLLLRRGGRVVYSGPLGDGACSLVQYFESLPGVQRLEQAQNPASWMLDVVGRSVARGHPDLAAHYATSSLAKAAAQLAEALSRPPPAAGDDVCQGCSAATAIGASPPSPPPPRAGALTQLRVLLARGWLSYWRNPGSHLARFAITAAIALIVGSIELGKGDVSRIRTARDVQNALGSLYMLASALATEVGFECQAGLAGDRAVFYRERAVAAYGAGPFLAAQVLVEVSYVTAQSLLYTLIVYFMFQLPLQAGTFLYVLALVWLSAVVAFLTAQALVQLTPSLFVATTAMSVLANLQSLTSGFTRPLPSAPRVWAPAFLLNPSFYAFVGIGSEVLGGVGAMIPDPAPPPGAEGTRVPVGEYVGALYGMRLDGFPGPLGSLGMLAAFAAVLLCASYAGMRWANFQRR